MVEIWKEIKGFERYNDNSSFNLEWVTVKENVAHALENGLLYLGEKNKASKLRSHQVKEIIRLLSVHNNHYLAEKYNVGLSTVQDIRKGRTWQHLR